jgi:hypothetical protein
MEGAERFGKALQQKTRQIGNKVAVVVTTKVAKNRLSRVSLTRS